MRAKCIRANETKNIMSQRNLQEEGRKNYQESGGWGGWCGKDQAGQHINKGFSNETHLSTRYYCHMSYLFGFLYL